MSPNLYEIKEEPILGPGFFCEECTIWHDMFCRDSGRECPQMPFEKHTSWGSCRPNRCQSCDRDLKRWLRQQKWKRKILASFDYEKHRFLKFGTIGLPGHKIFPIENEDDYIEFRERLTHNFKLLRKDKLWKECVDGGMWFFEVTETPIPVHEVHIANAMPSRKKINPHLHILQELCAKHGLGRFKFSKPTDKAGNDIMPGIKNALYYTMSYLKKETQVQGKNRDTFGVLR